MSEFDLEKALSAIVDQLARQPEVMLVYLYGSYAADRAWAESDLDIGVLFDEGANPSEVFRQALRDAAALESKTGGVPVDLRVLNHAPVEFAMQVVKHNRCLYARQEQERVQFETRVIREYLDFKPVLDEYYRELRRRIKEGRFSARLPRYIEQTRAAVQRARETRSDSPSVTR
jgi:hypothetical protein